MMARTTDNAGQDVCRGRDCCCRQIISEAPGSRTERWSQLHSKPSHLSALQSPVSLSLELKWDHFPSPCPCGLCQGSPALGSSSHRTQRIIRNNVTQILLHNDQWVAEKVHCLLCKVSGISFTASLVCVTLANKQVYGQSRD